MKSVFSTFLCLSFVSLSFCSNGATTAPQPHSKSTTHSPDVTTKNESTTTANPQTTEKPVPTTAEPKVLCNTSTTCATCTDDHHCYWCSSTKRCEKYIVKDVVPRDCPSKHWYWKQCTISGQILIIVIPSVVGFLLLLFGCCIYCKCCRNKKSYAKEDARLQRRKEERRQKESQRKADRKERTDDIRRKYGLLKDEDEEPLI